jgi:hypothetical protein
VCSSGFVYYFSFFERYLERYLGRYLGCFLGRHLGRYLSAFFERYFGRHLGRYLARYFGRYLGCYLGRHLGRYLSGDASTEQWETLCPKPRARDWCLSVLGIPAKRQDFNRSALVFRLVAGGYFGRHLAARLQPFALVFRLDAGRFKRTYRLYMMVFLNTMKMAS